MLIQETIRHDIGKIFPQLKDNIKGEESNKFENALGEKIIVEITENPSETTKMLQKVLDGNENAATALASEIHKVLEVDEELKFDDFEIEAELGIWIDPIDATQEYISGKELLSEVPGIFQSGLQCATVLIGVYDIESGIPVLGIVNQPFANELTSRIFFGVAIGSFRHSNVEEKAVREPADRISILSSSESLKSSSFTSVFAAGAGYKSLKVIEGDADIYFLSKASTFKWDTCGPQAILRALGGDILDMKKSIKERKGVGLTYLRDEPSSNEGGIIAYRKVEDFEKLLGEM